MKKNTLIIIIVAIFFAGVAAFLWMRKKEEEQTAFAAGTAPGCISVPSQMPRWTEDGWYGNGVDYITELFGKKFAEYNLISEDQVGAYGAAFLKAIGLKVTKDAVKKYQKEMEAYLKSYEKVPHWEETTDRLRCAG